ncbi:MAG TPA: hypothetical protein VL985_15315 [Stellaceae bacterium]|nr:hypothetical protein [Stellaceae bacterium]
MDEEGDADGQDAGVIAVFVRTGQERSNPIASAAAFSEKGTGRAQMTPTISATAADTTVCTIHEIGADTPCVRNTPKTDIIAHVNACFGKSLTAEARSARALKIRAQLWIDQQGRGDPHHKCALA